MSTTFLKKYKVLEKIGEGSFSEVLKCQERENGVLCAAKRLKKIYQNMSEILESPEVIAMRKISHHPNILYMVESHCDPLPGKVTLIFELMDMSLYDLVKARKGQVLMEQRVKVYLYQLLKGLEHLHKHGIFHRDIKPENILLKGDLVKLADLGSIRGVYSKPPYTEYISTRWYRSPECLLTTGFYGPKMDVWATGCVFYELLTLKPLFPGANEVDQIIKIHAILGTPHARLVAKFRRHKSRNCEYFFPTNGGSGITNLLPQVTETGRDVLKLMLIYDPENRSNVKRLLEHRYFNDLRENESPRQLNVIMPSNSSHNTYQWRNPVLLSYITSERRRKTKPLSTRRLKFQGEDLSKVPRIIASSPNARLSLSNESNASKISKSDKSNVTIINNTKQFERTWGTANISSITKQQATPKNSGRSIKNCMSEITESSRLPSIKHSSKMILSKEMNMNPLNTPAKHGLSALVTQYNFNKIETFNQSCKQKIHYNQKAIDTRYENKQYNSFLPRISHKSDGCYHPAVDSTGLTPNQNDNINTYVQSNKLYKTKLATIKEQPIPNLMARKLSHNKSPIMKSPAKKIAKHEMPTSLKLCTIATKKLKASPKRIYERRYKYGIK